MNGRTVWKITATIIMFVSLLLVVPSNAESTTTTGLTTRVSVASDGTQGNDESGWPSISADGRYVAFQSWANNLVSGDTNGYYDIFVHDLQTGQTTRVSVASDGTQGNGDSEYPSISADGRYVAFQSWANNLVSGDTNGASDIFVHSLETGQTRRVSIAFDGTEGNQSSSVPAISANGRYVGFTSWANNLVPGDTNGIEDVFVHDMQTGQTERISIASDGTEANSSNGVYWHPPISADGRFVAFYSFASNLVPDDVNGHGDIFVRDRSLGQTELVSVATNGEQADLGGYGQMAISSDGRFVTFRSPANNLVPGDTNSWDDIFIRDRQVGKTERISVSSEGVQANKASYYSSISTDGRYVAFESYATNLVSGDTNGASDVFVHDLQTGQTRRVSVASDGTQGNSSSVWPSISADGRYVAFYSGANNLVSGDTNSYGDAFVYEWDTQIPISWTLMFYLDGDNNLDNTYPPIFNQLEAAANNPNVQVVALWDKLSSNNSGYYNVQYDTDLNHLAPYTNTINYWPKGELNMGASTTLVDFVNWARTNYPAEHYALILSDHGSGLNGGMWDETNNDHLTVTEVGSALASATLTGTNKIDVLYMDACLMAMIEDAYQVRNYVNYYVASENLQWSYTTAYSRYVSEIGSTTTPSQLATLFSQGYADEMSSESTDYTIAAGDISKLDTLVTAVDSLASSLRNQMETYSGTLTTIAQNVQRFDNREPIGTINPDDEYIDLYDFARLVKTNIPDSSIQTAAQSVMDAVSNYIIDEHHQIRAGTAVSNNHGVSIFFPREGFQRSFYTGLNLDFANGTVWGAGQQQSVVISLQETVNWGPMLVDYIEQAYPNAPDDPNPPELMPRQLNYYIYLPLVLRLR